MFYEVLNIAELIDHFDIPVDTIEEVTAAWGEGERYGVCLTTLDGFYILWTAGTNKMMSYCHVRLEPSYHPYDAVLGLEDWEDNPTDITRWLEESGRLDEAHMY